MSQVVKQEAPRTINYKSLSAFLQGVAGNAAEIRLEAKEWAFLNRKVWGVLLSTHLQGDVLHFVWVEAARRLLPNPQERATAQAQQQLLLEHLRRCITATGLLVAAEAERGQA